MHAGVKYIDRTSSQPPSVVPAKGTYTDGVLPVNRVWYREGHYSAYYTSPGGWEHLGIIIPENDYLFVSSPSEAPTVRCDSLELMASANVGRRVGVLLPLEIQGIVNEYTFWFEVKDYSVQGPVAR